MVLCALVGTKKISIHALREEGDWGSLSFGSDQEISIHALREEGDASRASPALPTFYFYPRPPRGGRRFLCCSIVCTRRFLSTPSARRATRAHDRGRSQGGISIHALREEGDEGLPGRPQV